MGLATGCNRDFEHMTGLAFDTDFAPEFGVAVELSPLLRRITCNNPGPFTFRGTNTFIIGRGSVAVVDPGPDDEEHFSSLLKTLRGETVSHIVVTHTHMDHSPLAARLSAATGAKTYGAIFPANSTPGTDIRLDASIDREFTPDVALADGDVIAGRGWNLEAVFTPGHLANHMSFSLREEKALLSGDHVMAWATSVVAPPEGKMNDYMGSLRKLLKRDEAVYHPAHGPARRDPLPLVQGILAHREAREEAIYSRVKAGSRSLGEIVAEVYAGIDPQLQGAAALSALAHLEHLIEKGRIAGRNGVYSTRNGGENARS